MRRLALLPLLLPAATGGCHRQEPAPPQARPAPTGATASPKEEAGAVDIAVKGRPAPETPFAGPDGSTIKIADLKGKPVLVNLWATWCGPCVRELPTLDALAAREAGKLTVLAISQDLEGRRVIDPFWTARHFTTLKPSLDANNGLMLALREASLPVTILYGADGRELWRVRGGIDWSGAGARALLARAGV